VFGRVWRRCVANIRRSRTERDLDDEILYHLDQEVAQLRREGLDERTARTEARKAFGAIEVSKEASRDARGIRLLHDLRQDIQYALRLIGRQPAFAATIAATIAVAVAANTTLFGVVYGVLLKPLPFPQADRLVVISEESPTRPRMPVPYPDYLDWRARQHVFDDVSADLVIGGVLTGGAEAERVFGRAVTRDFFSTLNLPFALGRPFTDDEDRPGGPRVAIIGHALWQRRYGGNPAIVGHSITYNGDAYEVVGVLPAEFEYYGRADANNDLFLPLGQSTGEHYMVARDMHPLHVTARLRSDVPLERASADMRTIAAALAREHRETNADVDVRVRPLLDDYVGNVRTMLLLLFGSAAIVLAIACANIANLLLVRMTTRGQELAMRRALGASGGRLARQFLTESAVLAGAGGAAGVVIAASAIAALPRLLHGALPRAADVTLSWPVAVFALTITILSGAAFGAAPALIGRRSNLREPAGSGGRTTAGGRHLRDLFVLAQIALSTVLLTAAGLLVRSFDAVRRVDPGYTAEHVETMRVRLPDAKYSDRRQVVTFLDTLLARVAAHPGVESVCLTTGVPLGRANEEQFLVRGQPAVPGTQEPVALTQWVTDRYFRTFGIPVIAGRALTAADREGSAQVAVVDEQFATRYGHGENVASILGTHIRIVSEGDRWRDIVGVVRHLRHAGLEEQPRPEIYAPYLQMEPSWQLEIGRAMDLAVRSQESPEAVVTDVRSDVRALDPDLPLSHVRSMTDAVAASIAPRAFSAAVLLAFGVVALLLSMVGIYGVMSYSVSRQTAEIGVRLALGAQRHDVLRLVLRRVVIVLVAGAGVGIAVSLAAGGLLQTMLYGVTIRDPLSFAVSAFSLVAAALVAAWIPVRRALELDPVIAVRQP
jgi:putative ABC transport system permease protein